MYLTKYVNKIPLERDRAKQSKKGISTHLSQ